MDKSAIYEALYGINQNLAQVSEHLQKLQELGTLTPEFVEIRRAEAEQMRAEVNHRIIDARSVPEMQDAVIFQRLRIALETRLNGKSV